MKQIMAGVNLISYMHLKKKWPVCPLSNSSSSGRGVAACYADPSFFQAVSLGGQVHFR